MGVGVERTIVEVPLFVAVAGVLIKGRRDGRDLG